MVRERRDDPDFAAESLGAALEDTDEPQVLLIVLRREAEAKGGIAQVAKAAGLKRTKPLPRPFQPRQSTPLARSEPS